MARLTSNMSASLVSVLQPTADLPILLLRDLYFYGSRPAGCKTNGVLEATRESTEESSSEFGEGRLQNGQSGISNGTVNLDGNQETPREEQNDASSEGREEEIVLIDDHATHPRVIRHKVGRGFHLVQFGPFSSSRRYSIDRTRENFIEYVGLSLG